MTQTPGATSPTAPPAAPRRGVDDAIFDKRALLVGAALCALLCALALVWKVASRDEGLGLGEVKEFQFSIADPKVEEFKVREVVRDIVRERPPTDATLAPLVSDERPNIHMTVKETNAASDAEVIQSPGVSVAAADNELKIDVKHIDVLAKTDVNVPDGPEEISAVTDAVGYQMSVIAADAGPAPADLFKYDTPTPRDKPALYTMNVGPRPGRSLKGVLKAFGDQDAPSMGELGPANINLFGTGDVFRSLARGSGGVQAKSSVDSALHWLAAHQGPDGSWDAGALDGEKSGDLAATALATLAFMGGGNTTRKGDYSRNVLKGLEAIIRRQKDDGHVTQSGANHYTHAICTIALAEAYGRARDERVGAAAQKAVDYCQASVNADGGWRYTPKSEASDLSVTAWFIQAFKTAKLAQLKSDHAVYSQALAFVDSVTDKGAGKDSNGVCGYTFQADQEFSSNAHPALTCAGMLIRQFTGVGVKNHLLTKGAELTRKDPPDWNRKDFYYWYYATYAMHNMGGEYRVWWNQKVRDVLLERQGRDGDNAGSWDPKNDRWARAGGRVYTTALGALCLEVYYRYSEALNSFGVAPDLDELFFQQ